MKSALLFDFVVNKENNTIHIKREFNASLELVWLAWTTPELLDQWCAPNPYRTETKTMDFHEGGFWHYAIVSPEGNKHWSRYDYKKIEPQKSITELRTFSNESGTLNPEFLPTECSITFGEIPTSAGSKTLVTIVEKYGSPEMFERMATDSHKRGFSSHLKNLDRLLLMLKKKKDS
ncbi:MAG: SRPBCC domain-containing protein [Chitinophagaceae bacterium]|nr:SRPBCC domain-containing protein [Chitinophagaceae bacterium]